MLLCVHQEMEVGRGERKRLRRGRGGGMLMYIPVSFFNAEAFGVHLVTADSFNMPCWYAF